MSKKKNRVTSLDFGIWLCIVGGTESVRGFPTELILQKKFTESIIINNISLLSVYLSQSKKKWWEFSHGAPQLQEAFDKILTLHKS